jgi:SAM-dependent methyltransferase
MLPKPAHLGSHYAAQFEDASVAAAYRVRPPYPAEFFSFLERLHVSGRRNVLELGSGTGDVTFGLLNGDIHIDAIEPSAAMLSTARRSAAADDPRIHWICAPAETAEFGGRYSLAIAVESLHWMEWDVVLPKIAEALKPGAFLALAERNCSGSLPWDAGILKLLPKYSTNREYRPYDLVNELTRRRLFRELGRHTTAPVAFSQSIDDYIESLHSRNGFSRERMGVESARLFDNELRLLLERDGLDGTVLLQTIVNIVWGIPAVASQTASD